MFVDDVMVFFDGGCSSLHGITETLDDFAGWSGLNMNINKLFHAGLSEVEAHQLTAYGFSHGTLPICYLGPPLMHRKLKIAEYSPLLDKLNSRFNHWATKSLSFAGRCLLIKTVITGTVIFWTSTFLLPKGCIKHIESLCKGGLEYCMFAKTRRRFWPEELQKMEPNPAITACLAYVFRK